MQGLRLGAEVKAVCLLTIWGTRVQVCLSLGMEAVGGREMDMLLTHYPVGIGSSQQDSNIYLAHMATVFGDKQSTIWGIKVQL